MLTPNFRTVEQAKFCSAMAAHHGEDALSLADRALPSAPAQILPNAYSLQPTGGSVRAIAP